MQILIIGGTGFIGRAAARRLVGEGVSVCIFHRGQTEAELPPSVSYIRGDRKDLPSFANEFKHLAPQVVLDLMPYTERDAIQVMEAFRDVAGRVVAVSSQDVYKAFGLFTRAEQGPSADLPFNEDAPLRGKLYPYRARAQGPDDLAYDYEKILVERVVLGDARLPGTVLRLPMVYGPGDKKHRLHEYLKRIDDGRSAILLQKEKARWRWTRGFVENVAEAIALAVLDDRAMNRTYNVGETEALTEAEWVRSVGRAARWDGKVVTVVEQLLPGHLAEPFDWGHDLAADTSRIREELGFKETVSRDDALKQTVAWERANPPQSIDSTKFDYAAEDKALEKLAGQL
jgi:nucleoside-diphosphate-sugar epimerase